MSDKLEYVISNLRMSFFIFLKITLARKNHLFFDNSYQLLNDLNQILKSNEVILQDGKGLKNQLLEIESKLRKSVNDLYLVLKTELRYILYPEKTIKEEAFRIGKDYMNNFFDWLKDSDNYSNDELYKIVQTQLLQIENIQNYLNEAHIMLRNLVISNNTNGGTYN